MKSFSKVLIANRGEIAIRIIRACRGLGITSALVFDPQDRTSLAVELADEVYELAPCEDYRTPYLDGDQIVKLAVEVGCDAIHPGYGFLSENPTFAAKIEKEEGLTLIGPSSEHIAMLGDKNEAREAMEKAGLPLLPGSDGPVASTEEALALAQEIGYPVLIKAAAGGGGRGMRRAQDEESLKTIFNQAVTEAEASFGNGSVFVEKYVEEPRHIEVQIVADSHGNVVHLGERECSIQRRFQKLVEESPSPIVNEEMRLMLGEYAIAGARSIGYLGLGTFEFIMDQSGAFYFLEVNTRLQVEHTVTEMVYGVDLVEEQIRIAAGEKLSWEQLDLEPRGVAIECRITCEDSEQKFLPTVGKVEGLKLPMGPGVRVDTHLYQGYDVPQSFDSMIAKLIVWGADREQAIRRTLTALREFEILGFPTTIPFYRWLFHQENFLTGDFSTHYIERHWQGIEAEEEGDLRELATAVYAVLARSAKPSNQGQRANAWSLAGRRAAVASGERGFSR